MAEHDWRAQAACRGMDTRLWYPERGEPTGHLKKICNACPVQAECLAYAMRPGNMERFGFWGGQAIRDRTRPERRSTAA